MYHGGEQAFWEGWQAFTESATPVVVNPHPRLVLVAREFQERAESAFDFLIENNFPIKLVRVTGSMTSDTIYTPLLRARSERESSGDSGTSAERRVRPVSCTKAAQRCRFGVDRQEGDT